MRLAAFWLMALLALGSLALACAGDDDDDSADDDTADDDSDDDDDADDDTDDDLADDDVDDDDVADDDTGDDDTDACPPQTDDGSFTHYYENLTGQTLVAMGTIEGLDLLAVQTILALSGGKVDSAQWQSPADIAVGEYVWDVPEGDDLGEQETAAILVYGLNLITQAYDSAYAAVRGCASIDATGGVGDLYEGQITNTELRPVNIDTLEVDWDSGDKAYIGNWMVSSTIIALPTK